MANFTQGDFSRKLTRQQVAAINRLDKLADYWPDGISLFATGTSLMVITDDTMEIMYTTCLIPADGGDPDIERIGGREFLGLNA